MDPTEYESQMYEEQNESQMYEEQNESQMYEEQNEPTMENQYEPTTTMEETEQPMKQQINKISNQINVPKDVVEKVIKALGLSNSEPTEALGLSNFEQTEPFTVREGFSNKATYGKKLLQLDLFLRALLYGCLFFLLAHSDTRSLLMKFVSKKNLMYVVPVIFALAYYVLNLYI